MSEVSNFCNDESQPRGTVLTAIGINATCIDLSWDYDESTIFWPGGEGFKLCMQCSTNPDTGDHYAAGSFSSAEHGGTHVDGKLP